MGVAWVPGAPDLGAHRSRAAPLLAVAMLACGSGMDHARDSIAHRDTPGLEITPAAAVVVAGGTVALAVRAAVEVDWDVAEVASPPAGAGEESFPLRVSRDGRFLVDRHGRPWRIQADAAWQMSAEATPEEVDSYLDTRRSQGFNSFYLLAAVHEGAHGRSLHAPNDRIGNPPFATPGLFTTAGATLASRRYWEWIDSIVEKAASRGMAVMLAYTYLGYEGGDEGWYRELLAQPSREACFAWGEWLGRRFAHRANVLWLALGDYTPPRGSEGEARALAVIEGIKSAGATQLFLAEPSGPAGIPTLDAPAFAHVVDMNSFYGYGPTGRGECYLQADAAYNVSPPRPAWVQEGGYEFEDNTGKLTGKAYETRRTRFWAVLGGGIAGDGFGSREVWLWRNLPASLHSPGAAHATVAFELFSSLPWWELRPSGVGPGRAGRELVTAGAGTWGDVDFVTSAVTARGSHLLAYVPPRDGGKRILTWNWLRARLPFLGGGRSVGVDVGALAGPFRARWFDPATGAMLPAGDGRALSGQVRVFTTPAGRRADGSDDWVLLLDAGPRDRCGSVSPAGIYTAPARAPDGIGCQVVARTRSNPAVATRIPVTVR